SRSQRERVGCGIPTSADSADALRAWGPIIFWTSFCLNACEYCNSLLRSRPQPWSSSPPGATRGGDNYAGTRGDSRARLAGRLRLGRDAQTVALGRRFDPRRLASAGGPRPVRVHVEVVVGSRGNVEPVRQTLRTRDGRGRNRA